ncbi:hypothetical protein VTI28DRAFT_5454 [Corynascus sepedonium]
MLAGSSPSSSACIPGTVNSPSSPSCISANISSRSAAHPAGRRVRQVPGQPQPALAKHHDVREGDIGLRRLARALSLWQEDAPVGAVGAEPGAQVGRALVGAGCGSFAGLGGCIVDGRVAEGGLGAVVFEVAVEEHDGDYEAPEDCRKAHFGGVSRDVGFSIEPQLIREEAVLIVAVGGNWLGSPSVPWWHPRGQHACQQALIRSVVSAGRSFGLSSK